MVVYSGYELSQSDATRFWSKVDKSTGEDGCWNWSASKHRLGYGNFSIRGRRGIIAEAHRVAYALHYGAHPDGCVMHTCDNRGCCNPKHLKLGSHQENMRDCADKKRNRSPRPGNGYTKIDENTSHRIYMLALGGKNFSELGRMFDVKPNTIRNHFGKHYDDNLR